MHRSDAGEGRTPREWVGLDRAAVECCGLRIRKAEHGPGVRFEWRGPRGGVKAAVVVAPEAAQLYRDDLLSLLPLPSAPEAEGAREVLLRERFRKVIDRLSVEVGELAPRSDRVERIGAAVREGMALLYPVEVDIDEHAEAAARAMARANDDGCFEDHDRAVANADLMSRESFDDEAGAGEEDREYYRVLASAALLTVPPAPEAREEDGDGDLATALFLMAMANDGAMVPEEADEDALFTRGLLRTRPSRLHRDEHECVLTPEGWEFVRDQLHRAIDHPYQPPSSAPVEGDAREASFERSDGLTDAEGAVMDALCEAANAFGRVEKQHPNEAGDFVDAIHRAQDLLAVRIARRCFPRGWPTYRGGVVDAQGAPVAPEARA